MGGVKESAVVFGVSFVAALGAVLLLARRSQAQLAAQGETLRAQLTAGGVSTQVGLIVQGTMIQQVATPYARSLAQQVAIQTLAADYGIGPQYFSNLATAARRAG